MKKISFTLGIILMIILICTSCAHIPSADNGFYFSDYAQEKPNELSETIITTNSTNDNSHSGDRRVVIETNGDSSSGATNSSFFEIKRVIKDNKANARVELLGEKIEGTYLYSRQGKYYNYEVDYYEYRNNDYIIQFGINTNSKETDYYSWMPKNSDSSNESVLSESECRAIAEAFLIENAFSPSDYQMIETKFRDIPEYSGLYTFEFDKTIQGTRTSEKAYISVTQSGTIASWNFVARHSIDISTIDSGWNKTEFLNCISHELGSKYSEESASFETQFTIKDATLCKMEDGNYYYVYSVEVCFTPKTEDVKGHTELVSVFLQLTE